MNMAGQDVQDEVREENKPQMAQLNADKTKNQPGRRGLSTDLGTDYTDQVRSKSTICRLPVKSAGADRRRENGEGIRMDWMVTAIVLA